MALNIQTFKTRTLSAIIFSVIMLAGLCFNVYLFSALMSIVLLGCLIEWYKMNSKMQTELRWLRLSTGVVYIFTSIISMFFIALGNECTLSQFSPLFPCAVLFSMWINDTMAYIVGSFIGKTPFSPISPKKTWEGTIGGGILCVAIITWAGSSLNISKHIELVHWLFIGIICAVFGTLGDLLESKMKRVAGVKDSGNILPGHGGFLDRFDSMLLAAPVVFLYVKLFIKTSI
jgi:phosphatidate cytidylyltransferase